MDRYGKKYQEIGYFYLHIWIDMDKMYQVSRSWILLPAHMDTYGYIWIHMDKMYQEVGYFYLHTWMHLDRYG